MAKPILNAFSLISSPNPIPVQSPMSSITSALFSINLEGCIEAFRSAYHLHNRAFPSTPE